MHTVKRIVILGPESTGKTTLSAQLAQHYSTRWVPEYAREYLLKKGMNYNYDDLLTIAKGQLALEEEMENSLLKEPQPADLIIVDTNMFVMQVWCEFVFQKCHSWILDKIVERRYDLYLLCNIDLPWVKDELREYPNIESRTRLYHMYKEILVSQNVPWAEISGDYKTRFHSATAIIDEFI